MKIQNVMAEMFVVQYNQYSINLCGILAGLLFGLMNFISLYCFCTSVVCTFVPCLLSCSNFKGL